MTDPDVTTGGRPAIVVDLAQAGFLDAVEVGRGGFGVVFRATQQALNRTVAVKLLHTDLDTVSRERFFREGRAMGGLSGHPNVVDVLQVGVTHSGRPYIVMPFQSLDSLAARVRREGPMEWEEATRLGVRLAGALESAHRVGTLHRDVKPANILLSDYGEAQLTDFGIARIEGGFETATGAFTGSLSYSAPEVLNGRPPTAASDIYGLSAALFSIIAGRAAFERREGEEIIAQFLRITGQPVPDLRGHGVPDALCDVLERAMAKEPTDRFASAEEFGRALQRVQREAGLPVAEMALPAARRKVDPDVTQDAAAVEDRSPRRTSNPMLPLVDTPWVPDSTGTARRAPVDTGPDGAANLTGGPPTYPAGGGPTTQLAGGSVARLAGGNRATESEAATAIVPDPDGTVLVGRQQSGAGQTSWPSGPPPSGGGPGPTPPPPGPQDPEPVRRRRLPLVAALVTVVVLLASLAVAGIVVLQRRSPTSTPGTGTAATQAVAAQAWKSIPDDPTPRQQTASTVADGTVWVLGGITDAAATTLVEDYDPTIGSWQTGIALPVPLTHAMAVQYRGSIVVLGGWEAQGSNLTAVSSNKAYAQIDGGWKELPPMLSPHVAGGAVVVGDEIVVSGGQADGVLVPTTEVFDGTSWHRAADLPTPREHLGIATDGTYAYVAGGRMLSSDKNSAAMERFDPKAGTWTALAAMPAPRGGVGAAFADGRVVVAGGEEPTGVDSSVFAYDIKSNSWSSLPDLPTGRHGIAVTAVGKTVYAIGGATEPSHTGSTGAAQSFVIPDRELQPAASWRSAKDAPMTRQFSGTTVADGKMWVAGGLLDGTDATAAVYGYDPTIDTWTRGPDLPVPLHHLAAVTWRDQVVVIGGWTPAGGDVSGLDSGRVFALRGGAWVELPALHHPRVAEGAAVVGDKIVVFGGKAGKDLVSQTEVFDGTAWTDAAAMPTLREHMSAASDGTYAYAVGGRNLSSDKNSAALERFDPATGAWQKLPDMPTPRGGVAAAFLAGRIIAVGGEEPTRVLPTVEAYDIETGRWQQLPPLQFARHGCAVAAVGNTVFTVGGARRPTHAASTASVEALDFS